MAQDIGPWTDLYSVGVHRPTSCSRATCRSTTPTRRSRSCCATSTSRSRAVAVDRPVARSGSLGLARAAAGQGPERAHAVGATRRGRTFEEIVIGLLGPRWRREARLGASAAPVDTPKPLTPAPFESTTADPAVSDEFQSFAWGKAGPETGPHRHRAAARPVHAAAAARRSRSGGARGRAADPAAVAGGAAPAADDTPVADSGFVTFGAPAPPPPTDALVPPPADGAAG